MWSADDFVFRIVIYDLACRVLPTDKSIGEKGILWKFVGSTHAAEEVSIRRHHGIDATCCLTTCYNDDNDDALSATLSQYSAF